MKKIKIALLFFTAFILSFTMSKVEAATAKDFTKNDLMYVEVNGTGRIITKTTKVDEIKSWYGGEAQIETDSLYGGKAYSFYIGDNYDDYIYIETLEDGRIFSFGSTDPSYKTNFYSYGDNFPWYQNTTLSGCVFPNVDKVGAGVYYYKNILFNGSKKKIVDFYTEAFKKDQSGAMLALNKHATAMFNSMQRVKGKDSFLTFNEDYFYVNQQFRSFGTSLQSYMYYMDYGYSYFSALGTKPNFDIEVSGLYILNPLQLAGMASSSEYLEIGERIYPVWDYNYENKKISGAIYSPTCFDRADEISLTTQETSRLGAGRQEYAEAIDCFSKDSNIYEITPEVQNPSQLVAGKLLMNKQNGITHYINAIRVAGGLGRLSAEPDGFNVAQHLATLLSYRYIELHEEMQHVPARPDGVSLEFYRTAIGYGTSWTSNLAYSAKSVSSEAMMHHINILLQDEDKTYNFGHRTYLLYPTYTKFGYGISPYFGVVELTGGRVAYDSESVGWPSVNGITFMESLSSNKFKWTCRFVSKYEVQSNTTAKIKCLNTGDEWTFNEEESSYNRVYQNLTKDRPDILSSVSNKVLMYDHSIEPRAGYVYVVTIDGLRNTETGRIESYSYRTVFEYADEENYPSLSNTLKIKTSNLFTVENRKDVYCAPIKRSLKLELDVDTSVIDKKVTWTSSNPDVVSVTQDGTIYAYEPSEEEVIITVKFDGSNVTDQIVVMPYVSLESVKFNDTKFEMTTALEDNSNLDDCQKTIRIEKVPEEVTEILAVDWVLIDRTTSYHIVKKGENNYSIESLSNPELNLNEYFEVVEINPVKLDANGKIMKTSLYSLYNSEEKEIIEAIVLRAKKVNPETYTYVLKTYVTAMSDMYRDYQFGGSCTISVDSPIQDVIDYVVDKDDTHRRRVEDNKLALEITEDKYEYKLVSEKYPEDATEELMEVNWESLNTSVAEVVKEGDDWILKVKNTGNVVLKRLGTQPKQFTLTVTAPVSNIEIGTKLSRQDENGYYIKSYSSSMTECQEELTINRIPAINTEELQYEVSDSDIAEIMDNVVKFKAVGKVEITIKNADGSVNSRIGFSVEPTVENFKFNNNIVTGEGNSESNSQNFILDFDGLLDSYDVSSTKNYLVDEDGNILIRGYFADFDKEEGADESLYPTIKYTVENPTSEDETENDMVKVDENTGDLIIKQGGACKVYASVQTPDGETLKVSYNLVVNKKTEMNNITVKAPAELSSTDIDGMGNQIYKIYPNVTYRFEIVGDSSSTDELRSKLLTTSTDKFTYKLENNVLEVTPKEAGEFSIDLKLEAYKYVVNKDDNTIYISSTDNRVLDEDDVQVKEIELRFVVLDYIKGDMDKNGFVNAIDAGIVLDLFKNGGATLEDYQIGDMDGNGIINATDAAMILDIFKRK